MTANFLRCAKIPPPDFWKNWRGDQRLFFWKSIFDFLKINFRGAKIRKNTLQGGWIQSLFSKTSGSLLPSLFWTSLHHRFKKNNFYIFLGIFYFIRVRIRRWWWFNFFNFSTGSTCILLINVSTFSSTVSWSKYKIVSFVIFSKLCPLKALSRSFSGEIAILRSVWDWTSMIKALQRATEQQSSYF